MINIYGDYGLAMSISKGLTKNQLNRIMEKYHEHLACKEQHEPSPAIEEWRIFLENDCLVLLDVYGYTKSDIKNLWYETIYNSNSPGWTITTYMHFELNGDNKTITSTVVWDGK